MTTDQLNALAHQIAYHAARSSIERHPSGSPASDVSITGAPWHDLTAPDKQALSGELVAAAIFYLDARGLLLRNAAAPYLVRVLDVADAGQPLMLEPLPA